MRHRSRLICGIAIAALFRCAAPALADHVLQNLPGTLTGIATYSKPDSGINVEVDYAVFAPGHLPVSPLITSDEFNVYHLNNDGSESLEAGVHPDISNQYVYAYELFNNGTTNSAGQNTTTAVSLLSVDFNPGTTVTGRGVGAASDSDPGLAAAILPEDHPDPANPANGTGATKYIFQTQEVGLGQHSELLLLSSYQAPAYTLSYIFNGGASANQDPTDPLTGPTLNANLQLEAYIPAAVPTPTAFYGGAATILLLFATKFARRAC